jgi:hypothetical protein
MEKIKTCTKKPKERERVTRIHKFKTKKWPSLDEEDIMETQSQNNLNTIQLKYHFNKECN